MSILILFMFVFYASAISIKISHLFRWNKSLYSNALLSLPTVAGLSIAPFILGLSTAFSLYFFPGVSHNHHLMTVIAFLFALNIISFFFSKKTIPYQKKKKLDASEYFYITFLGLFVFFLFFNSMYYPLTQNDALEYMTVARQMYFTNSLSSYPMMHQDINSSGFYGPWTHPPLYVSLLYLAKSIQGHALYPGIARLISPWIACLSTMLIYALARQHNNTTGILSALIFISTPLFFLGAVTSLIDCLPVLGFILTISFIIGLDKNYIFKWFIVGLIMGFALWAHSQGILILPIVSIIIVCILGIKKWKQILKILSIISSISIVIAIGPYIKNYLLFGSLISDNNAVFALPCLNWHDYFDYARGLDNNTAILQYGILKGWFALEAFCINFWLMTCGAFIYVRRLSKTNSLKSLIISGIGKFSLVDLLLTICLLFLFIYLSGTIVSVLAGMNLMIKNERYLLITLPFVSILSGYFCNYLIVKTRNFIALKKFTILDYLYYIFASICYGLILLMIYVLCIHYPRKYLPKSKVKLNTYSYTIERQALDVHKAILQTLPSTGLLLKARNHIPRNSLILSMRPADMYYLNMKMISYLDPRLIEFYQTNSVEKGIKILRNLGIEYIHVTDYSLPVQYNSVLNKILNNSNLSKLVISHLANEIYKLIPPNTVELRLVDEIYQSSPVDGKLKLVDDMYQSFPLNSKFQLVKDFTPGKVVWKYYKHLNLLGRKSYLKNANSFSLGFVGVNNENKKFDFSSFYNINHRHFSHIISSIVYVDHLSDKDLITSPNQEYKVEFELEGKGLVKLYMLEFNSNGEQIAYYSHISDPIRIGEIIINNSKSTTYGKRFIAKGSKVKFMIESIGSSKLFIKKAKLYKYVPYSIIER